MPFIGKGNKAHQRTHIDELRSGKEANCARGVYGN